jgi:hypothetical protein
MRDGIGHRMGIQQCRISPLVELITWTRKACGQPLLFICLKSFDFGVLANKLGPTFGQGTFVVEHYFASKSSVLC